jgi:hypothetical protein
MIDLRLGRWQDALSDCRPDSVIFDPPYGARTHKGARTTRDIDVDVDDFGGNIEGISYAPWDATDVGEFVGSWAPRTRRWIVAMTSHDLIPAWESAYLAAGMYSFAPVVAVIKGMGVRMRADGPASWSIYLMAARHTDDARMFYEGRKQGHIWRSLPGGYTGPANTREARGGRGKPEWLNAALVRDYSNRGDLVADPLAGWGGILRAAEALGRRAVGAENDAGAHYKAMTIGALNQSSLTLD